MRVRTDIVMAYLTKEQSERAMLIAKRIDAIIEKIGISKGAFYKESGVSSATLSQWRSGTFYPSKAKLDSAAKYLDVSADYLEFGLNNVIDKKENPTSVAADGVDELDKEALDIMHQLPPEKRAAGLAMLRGLLSN